MSHFISSTTSHAELVNLIERGEYVPYEAVRNGKAYLVFEEEEDFSSYLKIVTSSLAEAIAFIEGAESEVEEKPKTIGELLNEMLVEKERQR